MAMRRFRWHEIEPAYFVIYELGNATFFHVRGHSHAATRLSSCGLKTTALILTVTVQTELKSLSVADGFQSQIRSLKLGCVLCLRVILLLSVVFYLVRALLKFTSVLL